MFDWAQHSSSQLQWAAIFSDCEHEVLEVTSGHRVTLTYNLYVTDGGPASMATQLHVLDQAKLHFVAALWKIIYRPSFLPDGTQFLLKHQKVSLIHAGGNIGFACEHRYPHASNAHVKKRKSSGKNNLDCMMKGIDMAVYQAFRNIANSVHCEAYIERPEEDDYDRSNYNCSESAEEDAGDLTTQSYISRGGPPGLVDVYGEHRDELDPDEVHGFARTPVVWLNGLPNQFSETHVAYMTVRHLSSCLGLFSHANSSAVWQPG